jgi:class 3 adenylate cyclase/tetratricopeptide (TPR) repeat protein
VSAATVTCPSCGQENPAAFRMCGMCGASLVGESAAPREERKVVSIVFCDLVGSTARAERADPEDVRAQLSTYHNAVRADLEHYGGTVEKFIGDAVVAVFGAPLVHEDDPERAVRAAIAIRDRALEEGGAEVRIAVNTGEALVSVGSRPEAGEGLVAGDVVNTAARLQSAAPVNGILVGEATYRATERAIEYREHAPVEAKGKAQPVRVWEAVDARSALGLDVDLRPVTRLVGRQRELDQLAGALERARAEREPQLVTIVGVPGMGKSRLVQELSVAVEDLPDLIRWRQGRSLPYGEGVSFWALGEMVKAEAGILETDRADAARTKLQRTVQNACDGGDAPWVEDALKPLLGLGEEGAGGERREESFVAWRRFLEALAEQRPTVLVFEDLHWADEGLLDFVDALVDRATDVPLLVVASARPELLARRPGWGGGKPNAVTLSLAPLSERETAELVHALLDRAVLPADVQAAVLARAGGNPLYAEEFARLVAERGSAEGDLPVPDTVQALIAARLDALGRDEKRVLQDAAVVGKVFWPGALEHDVSEPLLHGLERREFIRRERRSAVGGELQYAFRHVLVRDVAYSQIPRAERAAKHEQAAAWIESLGRGEDVAELLAHHYVSALEYSRAAGRDTAALGARARPALAEAGQRARALGALEAAGRFFDAAIELAPDHDEVWAHLVLERANATMYTHVPELGPVADACNVFRAAGSAEDAARAEMALGEFEWLHARRANADEHFSAAEALVAGAPPSAGKAMVVAELARFAALGDANDHARELATEALDMAEPLDLPHVRANALNSRGIARVMLGDRGGVEDLEICIETARGRNAPELIRGVGNLASVLTGLGELERARALTSEGLDLALELGVAEATWWLKGETANLLYMEGRWDEARTLLEELVETYTRTEFWMDPVVYAWRARLAVARGEGESARPWLERAVSRGREARDQQMLCPSLAIGARLLEELGNGEGVALAREVMSRSREKPRGSLPDDWLKEVWFVLYRNGVEAELAPMLAEFVPTPWVEAVLALTNRDFAHAGHVYEQLGAQTFAADVRLWSAGWLRDQGRRAEADAELERSLAFWRSVGATRYIRDGERLLAAAS